MLPVDIPDEHNLGLFFGIIEHNKLNPTILWSGSTWHSEIQTWNLLLKILATKDPIDLEETMEAFLLELNEGYTLLSVKYDPLQFHRSAVTLKKKGLPMIEFPQTGGNLTEMGQNLYDLVEYGNIVLYSCKDCPLIFNRLSCSLIK